MRTIKFRCFYRGKMYFVDELYFHKDGSFGVGFIYMDGNMVSPDSEHVKGIMQFTGLHDKNGKEIYKDDVIRILYSDWGSKDENDPRTLEQYLIDKSTVGYVEWDEHNTGWVVMVKSKYSVNDDSTVMSSIIHGTHGFREVIGNRFENPELLAPDTHTIDHHESTEQTRYRKMEKERA